MPAPPRLSWPLIVAHAREIVQAYDTAVTLRQLFYRLVAAALIPNTQTAYSRLSLLTAEARRAGTFPALADLGREISRPLAFDGAADALRRLTEQYREDRTVGQPYNVFLGIEKRGMLAQLDAWFGERGYPVVAVAGYASQTLADDVRAAIRHDGRRAVLLYAGDFDASGQDILRDFVERVGCFDIVRGVALTAEQVRDYGLPPQPGKPTDTRADGFRARHGQLVQVEVDALDPNDLRQLFADALAEYADASAFEQALQREEEQRGVLASALATMRP